MNYPFSHIGIPTTQERDWDGFYEPGTVGFRLGLGVFSYSEQTRDEAGKVTNNWPHSTTAYRWHMRAPAFADFEMRV